MRWLFATKDLIVLREPNMPKGSNRKGVLDPAWEFGIFIFPGKSTFPLEKEISNSAFLIDIRLEVGSEGRPVESSEGAPKKKVGYSLCCVLTVGVDKRTYDPPFLEIVINDDFAFQQGPDEEFNLWNDFRVPNRFPYRPSWGCKLLFAKELVSRLNGVGFACGIPMESIQGISLDRS